MFNVIVGQMMQEVNRMESETNEISVYGMELEQAIGELESLSGMENPVAALKHQYMEIGDESIVLRQLQQSLNETISNYMNCEKRNCNHAEQSIVLYTDGKGV